MADQYFSRQMQMQPPASAGAGAAASLKRPSAEYVIVPCEAASMGKESEAVEQRLKSLQSQLHTEYGILDRLVYKNKNQHRRSSYFQFLLKVRRDLRLLQSANLEEILGSCFLIIHGKRSKQKVQLLESLKRRSHDRGKPNFLERLVGVARLLSQMIEPVLKAATEISTLLAQSFFMGFSLTILALLARIRVLVQQMLLDVVDTFNTVSSLSQKEQAVQIVDGGLQVFREYYPVKGENMSLESAWDRDKYVLVEKINESTTRSQKEHTGEDVTVGASAIEYQSITVMLGGDQPCGGDPEIPPKDGDSNNSDASSSFGSLQQTAEEKGVKDSLHTQEGGLRASLSPLSTLLKRKRASNERVAFVSVKVPTFASEKHLDSNCKTNI